MTWKSLAIFILGGSLSSAHLAYPKSFIPSLDRIRAKVEKARSDTKAQSLEDILTKKKVSDTNNTEETKIIRSHIKQYLENKDKITQLLLEIELELLSAYWDNESDFLKMFRRILAEYPASAIASLKQKLKERYDDNNVENNQALFRLMEKLS